MSTNKEQKIIRFKKYIREKLESWKDVSDEDMDFHLFSSITNDVFKVTAKKEDISPNPIIFRNFTGSDEIIDKAKEVKIFNELSRIGCGPRCFSHDEDMRIEEYIPSRNIKASEYKQKLMRRKLARSLAAIHKLNIPGLEHTPLFEECINNPKYFTSFLDKCDQDIYNEQEKKSIEFVRKAASPEEIEFVKSILPKDDIVFSHNDLLQGNVLVTEKTEDVLFIDYEYASYNFRGYDMGNMFKEAILDYDYDQPPYFRVVEDNFPNKEELSDFLRYYTVFGDFEDDKEGTKGNELINNDEAFKSYIEKYDSKELEKKVDYMYKNTIIGVMLSYYYWLIWGIKMHKTVEVDFDYIEFSRFKFEQYLKMKDQVIELISLVNKQ